MSNDEFLKIRDIFTWGTSGKSGSEPLKYVLLKDIDDEHLENIISWIKNRRNNYSDETLELMEKEHDYRLKQYRKIKLKKLNDK